jgi:transcriptional regulator with XRE-family HTH domain
VATTGSAAAGGRGPSPFGLLLRQWRALRGASQLRLATEAGISTRHLSFIETGRSQPSREMVVRLAETLDVPLRERNALLAAAGFAALYRRSDLEARELEPVGRMLDFLLERHEPFPAFLADRAWRALRANRAALRTFARFAGPGAVWQEQPPNLVRLTLHPDGLRPWIVNFDDVAGALVPRLQRERALAGPDPELAALVDEVLALPGLPESCRVPDPARASQPVLPLHLKREGLELRLFSAITTFDTPQDVTLQELRIESFMPADDASEARLRALAEPA